MPGNDGVREEVGNRPTSNEKGTEPEKNTNANRSQRMVQPPPGALNAEFVPIETVERIKERIVFTACSEEPDACQVLLSHLSSCNDSQLAMINPGSMFGLQETSNVPYGFQGNIEVDPSTGMETGNVIEDVLPGTSMSFPVPISAISTVSISSHQFANFLGPYGAAITARALKTCAAHASLRVSAGEANLVSQRKAGYIFPCQDGMVKLVRSGREGQMYLPRQMSGAKRLPLRANLGTMIIHQNIPPAGGAPVAGAAGAAGGAPAAAAAAAPGPDIHVYNTVAVVKIDGANIPGERLVQARDCYRALNQTRNSAANPRSVRLIASLLHTLFRPLFSSIDDFGGDNILDVAARDLPGNTVELAAIAPPALAGGVAPVINLKRPRNGP